MNNYYLRVEGVNLSLFIYDTNDLNTIRGGGLLLLNAMNRISHKLNNLKPVTQGASWGLFAFQASNDHRAVEVARKASELLAKDEYQHATFVVDVLPTGNPEAYTTVRDRLHALNRWRQMQSPSMALPQPQQSFQSSGDPVCELDQVRPSTGEPVKVQDTDRRVSAAVRDRRCYGQKQKQKFYEKITGVNAEYVREFEELTSNSNKGNLNHKMAVIYLDGNDFGKTARDYCTSSERQKEFDDTLRKKYQNSALKTLLEKISQCQDWKNRDKIRLETLLWGGDEIIWVVPAWKGWWMLGYFFQITRGNNGGEKWEIDGKELTHAAGLVFCHHNAPIHPIVDLAKKLGDLAKQDKTTNRVAYQILESFDHTGADLARVREMRSGPRICDKELLLYGDAMLDIEDAAKWFKGNLPKRRLYRIVDTLIAGGDIRKMVGAMPELKNKEGKVAKDKVETCFGSGDAKWLHMLELWDYIGA